MPWEITIRNGESDQPLGTKQAVTQWVSDALPEVEFGRPPSPPEEFFAGLPAEIRDSVRRAYARPVLEAQYETDDLVIQFYCDEADPIRYVNGEIRGQGNPLPVLARTCLPRGWVVISDADRSPVDLTQDTSGQWEHFCGWRDRAIASFEEEEPA